MSMLRSHFGATYVMRSDTGEPVGVKRDYKKAMLDAMIVATIAAMSVLMAFGFPPSPEAIYSTFLALVFGFFTSLARKLDIEIDDS